MGLDMYLFKKTYVQHWEHKGEDNYEVTVTKAGQPTNIDPKKVKYVIEEVGYWRKANQIHGWFVDNVQDGNDNCGEYHVDESQLEELLELCKKILSNKELAEELLPARSGFFFGGTSYDEWYFNDLEQTVEIIETLLSERNEHGYLDGNIYYQSSW